MKVVRARHYVTGEIWQLALDGDALASLTLTPPEGEGSIWLAPLLVDLQVNGLRGIDFLDPSITIAQIEKLAVSLQMDGVCHGLPTVTTQSKDRISQALKQIARAKATSLECRETFPAIHLEGPYLSSQNGPRGAHPLEHIRPPSWDEFCHFQEAADGNIGLLTVSPEYDQSFKFIQRCCDSGVLVSIGHTAATGEQIARAVDAGATLSTHLGNGAHGSLPRHPNYLWDQLAEERLTAMIIADGHHLPDEFLRCVLRVKDHSRVIAVSDITGLGGMPPGRYPDTSLGDVEVLENGKLVVAGQRQYLAGAARPLWNAIPRLLASKTLSIPETWDIVSKNPGRLLGRVPEMIRHPKKLDAMVFEWNPSRVSSADNDPVSAFRLLHVIRNGIDLTATNQSQA